jgi:tRNA-Thr(GGU) m(6)t(6)A37 methyltransferase TsaA
MTEQQLVRRLKTVLRRRQESRTPSSPTILTVHPIGQVEAVLDADLLDIVIDDAWAEALDGLEAFSHLWVIWWLSKRTEPPTRLRVHPERRAEMPLMGLFATRSPHRPNPIALTAVRLVERQGTRLRVEGLDAQPGSPVLDLKPYLRRGDLIEEANVPDWLAQLWALHVQEQEAQTPGS